MSEWVATAPHEFSANLIFADHGLQPFYALDTVVKQSDGSRRASFSFRGEEWTATLYYQSSGFAPPSPEVAPEWELEQVREFRISVRAADDPVGQRSANAHIAPRWPDLQTADGDPVSYPEDELGKCINVKISGSNIEFDAYRPLLERAASALDVNPRYVRNPHRFSNVTDAARYVRVHREAAGPVHARDGPLARLALLLQDDRSGYRKLVQNDDDHRGRNLPGYYHTATLGPERVREAFPSHSLPIEAKHYYAKEALERDDSDALRHPKVEVAYQASRWDDSLGVFRSDLQQLTEELERGVRSILAAAGIQAHVPSSGTAPFVPDAYFEVEDVAEQDRAVDADPDPLELDLTEIEQHQESIVIRHLSDGLSPVEWDALDQLVTDGSHVSPQQIADEKGRHYDSVTRALRRMDELVHREYGRVSLRSEHVATMVHEAVEQARSATRRAAEASARALEAAERGVDETTSAFMAWAARYGIDVQDRESARMELRLGETDGEADRRELVQEGFRLWREAGFEEERYRTARVVFDTFRGAGHGICYQYLKGRYTNGQPY